MGEHQPRTSQIDISRQRDLGVTLRTTSLIDENHLPLDSIPAWHFQQLSNVPGFSSPHDRQRQAGPTGVSPADSTAIAKSRGSDGGGRGASIAFNASAIEGYTVTRCLECDQCRVKNALFLVSVLIVPPISRDAQRRDNAHEGGPELCEG